MKLILLFASGIPFFIAAAAIGSLAALPLAVKARSRIAIRAGMGAGVLLAVVSATPAPTWLFAVAGLLILAWFAVDSMRTNHTINHIRSATRVLIPAIAILAIALEAPYQRMPALPHDKKSRIFVLGDSLSAQMSPHIESWPTQLAKRHMLNVSNLARPGESTLPGRRQAEALPPDDGLVIIALGGHDVLGQRAPADFETDLDCILARARVGGRIIIMFELPLPPLHEQYGRIQRRLAEQHGVYLMPKRVLSLLLADSTATVDGIHLSASGHAALAEIVWSAIRPALQPVELPDSAPASQRAP